MGKGWGIERLRRTHIPRKMDRFGPSEQTAPEALRDTFQQRP